MQRPLRRGLLVAGSVAVAAGIAWVAARSRRPEPGPGVPEGQVGRVNSPAGSPAGPAPLAAETAAGQRTTAAVDPSTAGPAHSSNLAWSACLDHGDETRIWDCLRVHLDPHPDAKEVGRHLCTSGQDPATSQALLLGAALDRMPAADALSWLREVEVACPRFLGWSVLEHAIEQLRARDPAWLQQFVAALTPDRLFAEQSGESGLLLAAHLREKGDLEIREWVERGARGEWGGTAEQIERAIGLSLAVDRTPADRLEFLRSVLASESVPGDGSLGSTFVLELLNPKTIAGGDSASALDTIEAALCDPRFKESAAATLCLRYKDDPPAGCDPVAWKKLRGRALEIGREIGLVIPK